MRDLWTGLVQWISTLLNLNNNKFIKTTKGRVGRVERHNKKTRTLSISFGRFNSKGNWIIKNIITISDSNIQAHLNKQECARELHNLHNSNNSSNSN